MSDPSLYVECGYADIGYIEGDEICAAVVVDTPTGGTIGSYNFLNPRRHERQVEPVARKKRKPDVVAPIIAMEWPVLPEVPSADFSINLDQYSGLLKKQLEYEQIRLERLQKIALADDDWLMLN